jgi:hypothetical protein
VRPLRAAARSGGYDAIFSQLNAAVAAAGHGGD